MASAVVSTSPRLGNAKKVPLQETRKRGSISLFDSHSLIQMKQRDRSSSISLSHCDEPSLDMSTSSFRNPSLQPISKPRIVYQNTYKTEPDRKFEEEAVTTIIKQTLSTLGNLTYDSKRCREHCKTLGDLLLKRVKKMQYKRYKIVCNITIGQLNDQSLQVVSRCIWDPKKDNFATATYENSTLFAVGTVYAVYTD